MLKFAFVISVPGHTPEDYCGTYENSESFNLVAGIDNMDMGIEYVGKLAAEGYTLINLCGDFDDEVTAKMQAIAGPDVKIRHADYFPEELIKVDSLPEFNRYGAIIVMRGVEEPNEVVIEAPDFYTKAIFVKDQEQANAAAKKLVDEKMQDIELCSWFTKEKTQEVIDAIGGAVAVGSCGL